jgi:hypothetical protein
VELGEPLERSASQPAERLHHARRASPCGARHHRGRAPGGPLPLRRPIGSGEQWLRTCPAEPVPGRFRTQRGWRDPFDPLAAEDPSGAAVVDVLAQEGSGTAGGRRPPGDDGGLLVEGVAGFGDDFMLGRAAPTPLPEHGLDDVRRVGARATAASARSALKGPCRPRRLGPPAAAGHRGGVGHQRLPRRPVPLAPLRSVARPAASARPDRLGRPRRGHRGHRRRRRELHAGDLLRRAAIPSRLAASPRAGAELRHQAEARNHASPANCVEDHNPSVTRSTDDQREQVENPGSRELLA